MRFHASVALAFAFTLPLQARAQNEPTSRTLGGHTFMYPASIDSAFVETYFATRTSARSQTVSNVPLGNATVDITSLGVRENVDFELGFADRWSAGIGLVGQTIIGTSGRALATQGAIYSYGYNLNGAFRILRVDDSGTQVTLRASFFGQQGGGRVTLSPLIQSVVNNPRSAIPDIISNFGDLLVTPASWYGGGASINIAQAITPTFSLQGSFRLDARRFTQSPFVPGQGRVDKSSTGWIPQAGVAFGVNPPLWPVAFSAEYRTAAQDSNDPTSAAHHLLAVAGYYSARNDLQLGVVIFGEFGLPALTGLDANGNPTGSSEGKAFSGQLVMRYFW